MDILKPLLLLDLCLRLSHLHSSMGILKPVNIGEDLQGALKFTFHYGYIKTIN